MPLFNYKCECGRGKRVIAKQPQACFCKCGQEMTRVVTAPSTSTKEVIDTGTMTKPLERYADATRLFKERARAVAIERGEKKE